MKAAVWLCLCNGCAWVWCSYLLAYLGREQIAEQLSGKAVTEIIAVILAYAIKSLVERVASGEVKEVIMPPIRIRRGRPQPCISPGS